MSAGADADAEQVAASLQAVRRAMREAIWSDARRLGPPAMTPQQVFALQVLVDHQRETGGGMSVSQLTERMGLAHSTVSGIVSRLEARELVERATDDRDRRITRIRVIDPVLDWVKRDLPAMRLGPLAAAMSRATPAERAAVIDGLETLKRLIAEA